MFFHPLPCPHSTIRMKSLCLSLSHIHLFYGPVEGCECYQGRAGAVQPAWLQSITGALRLLSKPARATTHRGPSCRPNCRITAWRMASYQVFKPSGRSICWRIWEVWSSRVMNGEKWGCQSAQCCMLLLCSLPLSFSPSFSFLLSQKPLSLPYQPPFILFSCIFKTSLLVEKCYGEFNSSVWEVSRRLQWA